MNVLFNSFLSANQIEVKQLNEAIAQKINLFWGLHEILEDMENQPHEELTHQKKELIAQLEDLDYEIMGDIEEAFEDRLQNNDRIELPNKNTPKTPQQNDIDILRKLKKIGRTTHIGKHEFKEMGLQTPLGWETQIGEFTIKRSSLVRFHYDLIEQ